MPPRWVRYIYERYGIYTILNHPLGRYGVTVDGVWIASTDYADPRTRATILAEIEAVASEFHDVPGLLMWLLGNENNYGLVWTGTETEDLPEEELDFARARQLYEDELMNKKGNHERQRTIESEMDRISDQIAKLHKDRPAQ